MAIDINLGPSEHLTWTELACHDGTVYPVEWRANRAIQLGETFELIRTYAGNKPITILSAYRTPAYNAKVTGSAKNSQHCQGRAIDLRPPSHMSLDEFYSMIRGLANVSHIRGIGKYKTFVHVDVRPGDHLALWYGAGVTA
jgi:uncharacterized protein YcbK (DUF882 family)